MLLELEILKSCSACDRTCGEDECLYRGKKTEQDIVKIPRGEEFVSVSEGSLDFMTNSGTYLRDELKGLERIESILKDKIKVL